MTPRFVFRRAAREELLEARNWYDAQRLGLGEEFARSIDGAIGRIGVHPLAYPDVRRGVRRAVLLDFPYAIYYRPHADWIELLAVFHHRRDPRVWQARAEV
ncbi:MAG: type II toxin-antitoxin system RelE/ParE family toxin [bacterium]